jgi:hypothetical protein
MDKGFGNGSKSSKWFSLYDEIVCISLLCHDILSGHGSNLRLHSLGHYFCWGNSRWHWETSITKTEDMNNSFSSSANIGKTLSRRNWVQRVSDGKLYPTEAHSSVFHQSCKESLRRLWQHNKQLEGKRNAYI